MIGTPSTLALGSTLKTFRSAFDIKADIIALESRLHKSTISRIESGRTKIKKSVFNVYCKNFEIEEELYNKFSDLIFSNEYISQKQTDKLKAILAFIKENASARLLKKQELFMIQLQSISEKKENKPKEDKK